MKNNKDKDMKAINVHNYDQKKHAECYQPLFDLLIEEYNITAMISDMDEIISASDQVLRNLDAFKNKLKKSEKKSI